MHAGKAIAVAEEATTTLLSVEGKTRAEVRQSVLAELRAGRFAEVPFEALLGAEAKDKWLHSGKQWIPISPKWICWPTAASWNTQWGKVNVKCGKDSDATRTEARDAARKIKGNAYKPQPNAPAKPKPAKAELTKPQPKVAIPKTITGGAPAKPKKAELAKPAANAGSKPDMPKLKPWPKKPMNPPADSKADIPRAQAKADAKHVEALRKKFPATHAKLKQVEAAMLAQVAKWTSQNLANGKKNMNDKLQRVVNRMEAAGHHRHKEVDAEAQCGMNQHLDHKAVSTVLQQANAVAQSSYSQTEAEYYQHSLKDTQTKIINAVVDAYHKKSDAVAEACKRVCIELAEHEVGNAGMHRWHALMDKFRALKKTVGHDVPGDAPCALVLAQKPGNLPRPETQLTATQKWLDQKLSILTTQFEWTVKAATMNLKETMDEMEYQDAHPELFKNKKK
jgi:hypothetical protein